MDADLRTRLLLLEEGISTKLSDLHECTKYIRAELDIVHRSLIESSATLNGEIRRVEQKLDDHALADTLRHDGTQITLEIMTARVNEIDRDTAVNKVKIGLWGLLGGGSLIGILEAGKRIFGLG